MRLKHIVRRFGNLSRYIKEHYRSILFSAMRYLLGMFFPGRCPSCKALIAPLDIFCEDCKIEELFVPFEPSEADTAKENVYCVYRNFAKQFIYRAKFNGNGYAITAASLLLFGKLKQSGVFSQTDIITIIPPTPKNVRERGYYLPHIMARDISFLSAKKYRKDILQKKKNVSEQKKLSETERVSNLKDAFRVPENRTGYVAGKRILVIDDVTTTGTTLLEAKRALISAGAKSVITSAFAGTVRENSDPS
jgi:ComF family protein